MANRLTPAEIVATEVKIGRKLTFRETMTGELARPDSNDPRVRQAEALFKPVLKTPTNSTIWDDTVADTQRKVDEERFAKLSPAERRLALAKDSQAKELQSRTDAAAMEAHLAKVKPQLAKLESLKDQIRLDPTWTAAEIQKIDFAIRQLQSGPRADADESAKLFAAPFNILADKKTALRNQSDAKRAEIQAEVAKLDAELASIGGSEQQTKPVNPALATITTADAAWRYLADNFLDGVKNDTPEAEEARQHFVALNHAESNARQTDT